jgi:hypothetical protein
VIITLQGKRVGIEFSANLSGIEFTLECIAILKILAARRRAQRPGVLIHIKCLTGEREIVASQKGRLT